MCFVFFLFLLQKVEKCLVGETEFHINTDHWDTSVQVNILRCKKEKMDWASV